MQSVRTGILAGGNWIIDHVKIIDKYPVQDSFALILDETSSNGGSPYNLLKNLSKMGCPFPLAGAGLVGDDAEGQSILNDCKSHGIDVSQMHLTKQAHTSYTDVMTENRTGRRTFFHQQGANVLLDKIHFRLEQSNAKIFHLAYLLLLGKLDTVYEDGSTGASRLLKKALHLGFKTSVDTVSENGDRFETIVIPALPWVNYLIINEYEAEKISGIRTCDAGKINPSGIRSAAKKLVGKGVRDWVIIHFPEGAFACNREGQEVFQGSVRIPPEKIKGTAGAGDAFAAGVLWGMHEEWQIRKSLHLGVCAAAASLFHSTCSEGVQEMKKCLDIGEAFGFIQSIETG